MTESYIKANINPLINSKKAESKPHIKYLVQNGAIDEIKTRVSGFTTVCVVQITDGVKDIRTP